MLGFFSIFAEDHEEHETRPLLDTPLQYGKENGQARRSRRLPMIGAIIVVVCVVMAVVASLSENPLKEKKQPEIMSRISTKKDLTPIRIAPQQTATTQGFAVVGTGLNYTQASLACQAKGRPLAVISTAAEWIKVQSLVNGLPNNALDMFVGGTLGTSGRKASLAWNNGASNALSQTIWYPGQPSGSGTCVVISLANLLSSVPCGGSTYAALCGPVITTTTPTKSPTRNVTAPPTSVVTTTTTNAPVTGSGPYLALSGPKNFWQAGQACQGLSRHLAVISNAQEQQRVVAVLRRDLPTSMFAYVGGILSVGGQKSTLTWVTGNSNTFSQTIWAANEPLGNVKCVLIDKAGKLHSTSCTTSGGLFGFVCGPVSSTSPTIAMASVTLRPTVSPTVLMCNSSFAFLTKLNPTAPSNKLMLLAQVKGGPSKQKAQWSLWMGQSRGKVSLQFENGKSGVLKKVWTGSLTAYPLKPFQFSGSYDATSDSLAIKDFMGKKQNMGLSSTPQTTTCAPPGSSSGCLSDLKGVVYDSKICKGCNARPDLNWCVDIGNNNFTGLGSIPAGLVLSDFANVVPLEQAISSWPFGFGMSAVQVVMLLACGACVTQNTSNCIRGKGEKDGKGKEYEEVYPEK